MQTASAVPSCPPVHPSITMPRRRRREYRAPDPHSSLGKFLAEAHPEGLRIPHKGRDHVLTLREIVEGSADAADCTPRELLQWLGSQFADAETERNTHSGPSGPDHSTESGHGHRRDLA